MIDMNKMTQKTAEALGRAQSLARENGNGSLEPCHLLAALLADADGLIPEILRGMEVDLPALLRETERLVGALPKLSGSGYSPDSLYMSAELDAALTEADRARESMQDEFVSVEHLFLGLLDKSSGKCKELFAKFGINKKKFLEKLKDVRGNTRVSGQNPEDTYNVLKKYGSDLVEAARAHKLDPVIGRDEEIPSSGGTRRSATSSASSRAKRRTIPA